MLIQNTAISSLLPGLLQSEYCAPVWCRSAQTAHTRLIDNALNHAMRIVTASHTNELFANPVVIQPAELCRQGSTFSQAYCSLIDPKNLLRQLMFGSTTAH